MRLAYIITNFPPSASIGREPILSLAPERGKADPAVWTEAYRRLEQQIAQV